MKTISLVLLMVLPFCSFITEEQSDSTHKKLIENLEKELTIILNWIDKNPRKSIKEFKKERKKDSLHQFIISHSTIKALINDEKTIYFKFNFKTKNEGFYGYYLKNQDKEGLLMSSYESGGFEIIKKNKDYQVEIKATNMKSNYYQKSEPAKSLYVKGKGKLKSGSEYIFTLVILKDKNGKI